MTLTGFLTSLKADPTNPASPTLEVYRGDLSEADAGYVTGDVYGNRAYALWLEPGGATTLEYADEDTEQVTIVDIIFELRCDRGATPEQQQAMLELWQQARQARRRVTHLTPDVPLLRRLSVEQGLGSPRTLTEPKNWLSAGLRFEATWLDLLR